MKRFEEDRSISYSSSSDPKKPHVPRGTACKKISAVLGRVGKHQGAFSFGGEALDLPVLPGLSVEGWGSVSLPLCKQQMDGLATRCSMYSKKSWTLTPGQLQMRNSDWEPGIQALCDLSAKKCGLEDVALTPVLSKLVVFGSGSSLERLQTSKVDGNEVATLVVLLPSDFSGGDRLVFQDGTQNLARYISEGSCEFKPQYLVFSAGSECYVEPVTRGLCAMMVYRLCLAQDVLAVGGNNIFKPLQVQLMEALMKLEPQPNMEHNVIVINDEDSESSSFALMLSATCNKSQIERIGVNAMVGVDRGRFQLLQQVNAELPPDKQLKFYLASLRHRLAQPGEMMSFPQECASWYLLNGEKISDGIYIEWSKHLSVLNPDVKTLTELCRNGNYCPYRGYERFAVVGWPESVDLVNTYQLMGDLAAMLSILAEDPVDTLKLRLLCSYSAQLDPSKVDLLRGFTAISLTHCQQFCDVIVATRDMDLVSIFLGKFLSRVIRRDEAIPMLAALVRTFGWTAVGSLLLSKINGTISEDVRLASALMLADALRDDSTAQTALTQLILHKARRIAGLNPSLLASHHCLGLLWKHAVVCGNPQVFLDVENIFHGLSAKLLGPVVSTLMKQIDDGSSTPEQFVALTSIAGRRRQWIATDIAEMNQPFTWTILDDNFPDADQVKRFLAGSEPSIDLAGFSRIGDARKRAKALSANIKAPRLEFSAAGAGKRSIVRMVKACGVFAVGNTKMKAYQAELDYLNGILEPLEYVTEESTTTGKKRPREENPRRRVAEESSA